MATLRKLNASGDTVLASWDVEQLKAGDSEAQAAVEEAATLIAQAQAAGSAVVNTHPGTDLPADPVRNFDPLTQDHVIILPRMMGGC